MTTYFYLTSLIILIGCGDYQNDPIKLDNKSAIISGASAGDILERTTNENSLVTNMQFFLDEYLVSNGDEVADTLVDYDSAFAKMGTPKAKELRRNIFTQIAITNLNELSKNDKVAFLINAYNFLAIQTVIQNYVNPDGSKLSSITDIGGESSFNAFSTIFYNVAGSQLSLDDIEKATLKPLLTYSKNPLKIDARFHFAVICAAKGCPILISEAYDGAKIDEQLTYATARGLELKRNLQVLPSVTKVTSLFDWYQEDFINHVESATEDVAGGEKAFINRYLPELELKGSLEFIDYDWSLNKANRLRHEEL